MYSQIVESSASYLCVMRLLICIGLWKIIMNQRITFDARHVRPNSKRLGDLAGPSYQNGINNIERLMFDVTLAQPLQDGCLAGFRLVPQGFKDEAALRSLGCQMSGRT